MDDASPGDQLRSGADLSFYGRTPTILIDTNGSIIEINAACSVLFGIASAGCKGQPMIQLEGRLGIAGEGRLLPVEGMARTRFGRGGGVGSASRGFLLETREIRIATQECRVETECFGRARLRVSELPRLDPAGFCDGSIIGLEILELTGHEAFRTALDRRLGEEILWEVYAASYDRILPELPFYQEVVERHCEALSTEAIGSILDVGAGTGNVAIRLLGLGKRVVAVDTSRAMLACLVRKAREGNYDRLTIVEDTAEHLPQMPDASVDAVNVLLALFDMNDSFRALGEATRILKPGGLIVATEPRECFDVRPLMVVAEESLRDRGLLELLDNDWRRIESVAPLIRDSVTQTRSHGPTIRDRSPWHAEALIEWLRQSGFRDLTFRESHLGNCATITGQKPVTGLASS
jgi:ubiquinone/menaquinone biosynthesis C-methylase UbiE